MVASVVVPAHDEGRVIRRLLDALEPSAPGAPQVVVVCNACTDDTAERARAVPGVVVVETSTGGKNHALAEGDLHAEGWPRFYVDADVVITRADLDAVARSLLTPGVLAAAPRRELDTSRSAWAPRAYYRMWEQLPAVRSELFGRGVIGVTQEGHARLQALPKVLSDDLAAAVSFGPHEYVIVPDAVVRVVAPRTWRDLLRRRVRVAVGTEQLAAELGGPLRTRTSWGEVVGLARRDPSLTLPLVVFLLTAVAARLLSQPALRRRDFTTWHRDESSRQE